MQTEADAVFLDVGVVVVVDAVNPLYGEEVEDVAYANDELHVGPVVVNSVCVFGQEEEVVVSGVLGECGVVLVGEVSPNALEGEVLAELKFLDERYAVEELAFGIPREGPENLAVHEHLHVVEQGECAFLLDVCETDGRCHEQWEG